MSAQSTSKTEAEDSGPVTTGPGSLLHRERLAQGLDLAKVAAQLHLSDSMIKALEDDDFEKLPGPVFIQGYLRNYARLLGLAESEILASFQRLCPEPEQGCLSGKSTGNIANEVHSSHGIVKLITWLIVIGLLALLVIWWQGRLEWQSPSLGESEPTPPALPLTQEEPEPATVAVETVMPTPEVVPVAPISQIPQPLATPSIALDNDALSAEVSSETGEPSLPQVVVPESPLMAEDEVSESVQPEVVETIAPQPIPTPTPTPTPSTPAVASSTGLVFEFSGPCWTEVRDVNGKARIIGEMQAGRSRTLDADLGPFSIVLGDASVVRLSINGRDYDLRPHVRGKVARFTLDPSSL